MGSLFSYSIVSSVLLCCGYMVYKWLFASERQHGYNRIMIYAIYLFALTLPIIISAFNDAVSAPLPGNGGVEIGLPMLQRVIENPNPHNGAILIFRLLLLIYLIGIMATTFYSIYGGWQIYKIVRTGERVEREGYTLILTDNKKVAPFSWIRYVVMSREDYESAGEVIIIHELRHLSYLHWIDLLFSQIVMILQWFNPTARLFREEFKTVHEYQADEAVIEAGINIKDYQILLIKKAVGTRFHSLANSLNHSKLKKRVTMMYKEKSSLKSRLGALLLVPAMALGCFAVQIPAFADFLTAESETNIFARSEGKISKKTPIKSNQEIIKTLEERNNVEVSKETSPTMSPSFAEGTAKSQTAVKNQETTTNVGDAANINEDESGEKIYSAVQETAQPEGGMKALLDFLHENIEYPEEAVKEGKEGRVIVRFVVEKNGDVGSAEIIKGVDRALDKEALRVVKMMPKWTPAKVDGEPVTSYFVVPVAFTLPKDEEKAK